MSEPLSVIALVVVADPSAVQLLPLSIEYCQAPLAASTVWLLIAMPANVFAKEPPGTLSAASEKLPLNSELTVAPGGLPVSSATDASVALPVATGASLTALTVILTMSLSVEDALSVASTVNVTL